MLRSTLQAGLRAASRRNNVGALRHMSKEIKFGVEGRNAMLVGVNTLADAVQVRHKKQLLCVILWEARVTRSLRQESRSDKIPFLRGFVVAKRNLVIDLHKIDENSVDDLISYDKKILLLNSHNSLCPLFLLCPYRSLYCRHMFHLTQNIGHSRTQGTKCYYRPAIRSTKNYQGWCDSCQVHRFR